MNTILLATITFLLAIILAVLLFRLPKATRHLYRVTAIWVLGLIFGGTVALAWLGFLVYAIYGFRQARATGDINSYVIVCILLLVVLGAVFVKFVNRFYDWWAKQRASYLVAQFDSLVDKYQEEVSLEFSETFKRQLRDSTTFQNTMHEATRLVLEAINVFNLPHTDEEREAFRKTWQAKAEHFAERVAQGDPLAVEVILKAIEKESELASVRAICGSSPRTSAGES